MDSSNRHDATSNDPKATHGEVVKLKPGLYRIRKPIDVWAEDLLNRAVDCIEVAENGGIKTVLVGAPGSL